MAKLGLPVVIVLLFDVKIEVDLMEKKALHLKERSKDAGRGAETEEKVAFKLEQLPEGYHAFHDIPFNVDHVVLGPGGIFPVETKSHRGKVDANGDIRSFLCPSSRGIHQVEIDRDVFLHQPAGAF